MAISRSRVDSPFKIWVKLRKVEPGNGCIRIRAPRTRGNYRKLPRDYLLTSVGSHRKGAVLWHQRCAPGVLDRQWYSPRETRECHDDWSLGPAVGASPGLLEWG